ncbi:MAG TPA: LLM class flavin-dependent oxidoreductase [Gemmatimonadaceae bacterium]|nr:LLM class flavin-dependent oxidoreductase [Gemmatimonadaceae bacterium]
MLPDLSVLDVVPIGTGYSSTQALRNGVELARLAERLGYVRYWLAEHHGMPNIASSSPEILIEHVASATERIRVGAGGIMLPNHAPLRIAEAFHTLEALHPGRIDLGLGRAPGTDPVTSSALRPFDAEHFPQQVMELINLSRGEFPAGHPFHKVRVVPSDVELPPIWILGSSGASARMAGSLGVGYGFASHFSPTPPGPALEAYIAAFRPSERFPRPHTIVGASVVCAPTTEEAEWLAKSMELAWVRISRGEFAPLPSPDEAEAYPYTPQERAVADSWRRLQIVGDPATVRAALERLAEETAADELMLMTQVHEHGARMRSFELVREG